MKRREKIIVAASLVLASACTAGPGSTPPRPATSTQTSPFQLATGGVRRGGTLHLVRLCCGPNPRFLDPAGPPPVESAELLKCCLLRTLYSYRGVPTRDGGSTLQPDLADGLPVVSADGLTWTFHLKPGLHYAPPFQHVLITAGDIARAIERSLRVPKPEGAFTSQGLQWRTRRTRSQVIDGVDDFLAGRVDTISGIEVVNDLTLRVRLVSQAGDLASRLAVVDTAPVPPGADTGHLTDYGRFLVASGPYMVEGSERLDFSKPSKEQLPLSGFQLHDAPAVAGGEAPLTLVLVRNPSWNAATDLLRPAYVDRIEVRMADAQEAARMVDSGAADLFSSANPAPQIPLEQLLRYSRDPALMPRLKISPRDFIRSLVMNVAVPPFDDIHVRKAVNWALDKRALQTAAGGPLVNQVAGHLLANGFVHDLLSGYDAYRSPGNAGDMAKARHEMALSRYDRNHDGSCDQPACHGLEALTFDSEYFPAQAGIISTDLRRIGIEVTITELSRRTDALFARLSDPRRKIALALPIGFARSGAFPDAAAFMSLFSSPDAIYNTDHSMLGAGAAQLAAWGYTVQSVPDVSADVHACDRIVGNRQDDCWARLDQRLMETVVPWAPYAFENDVRVVSTHVTNYSFDQNCGMPALDQIAVR